MTIDLAGRSGAAEFESPTSASMKIVRVQEVPDWTWI
jgi:hypothetical protein